jgi:hypothetical protein
MTGNVLGKIYSGEDANLGRACDDSGPFSLAKSPNAARQARDEGRVPLGLT